MRRAFALSLVVLFACGCDPTIQTFTVTPTKLACPGDVTVHWKGSGKGGHLDANHPVTPQLPSLVPKTGSLGEHVTETTTFTFFYPGAGHREETVSVDSPTCAVNCMPTTLQFTGTCVSNSAPPNYTPLSVSAATAPGKLTQLLNMADFPVHVWHAGQEIALGVAGGPILPLPDVPAAGDYNITLPGQVGLTACAGAGPTRGAFAAPPVTIVVTPTCPKK